MWQLRLIMGRSRYLYTLVPDGCPGIKRLNGCSCMWNVRSTAVALKLLDLMKLALITYSKNGYASFSFFFNSSLKSQFCM